MKTNTAKRAKNVAPHLYAATFAIRGNAPYIQHRFPYTTPHSVVRDFEKEFQEVTYRGPKKEYGIPTGVFRNSIIRLCPFVGYPMSKAKSSIFIQPDFLDIKDNRPMIKIHPKPTMTITSSKFNPDLKRAEPMWKPGWTANVTIRFDANKFDLEDIAQLLRRAGQYNENWSIDILKITKKQKGETK